MRLLLKDQSKIPRAIASVFGDILVTCQGAFNVAAPLKLTLFDRYLVLYCVEPIVTAQALARI